MKKFLATMVLAVLPMVASAMIADTTVRDTIHVGPSNVDITAVNLVKVARPAQLDDPRITSQDVRWFGLWRLVDSNSRIIYTVTPEQGYSPSNDVASIPRKWTRIDDLTIGDLGKQLVFELFLEDAQRKVAPIILGVIGPFRMSDFVSSGPLPSTLRLSSVDGSTVIECTLDWE